jgi:hypothetical protein
MLDPDFSKTSTKDLEDLRYNSQFGSRLFLGADCELQKRQMQRTSRPHWVIWATFVAGAIAAIAAVILLFR